MVLGYFFTMQMYKQLLKPPNFSVENSSQGVAYFNQRDRSL